VDRAGHEGPSKTSVSGRASSSTPPPPVAGLSAVQLGKDGARVTWQPSNASLLARYVVYISGSPIVDIGSPNVSVAGNVTATAEPFLVIPDLAPGATYHFAVVAVDARGRTSTGPMATASVTLQAPGQQGASFADTWGPPALAGVLLVALLALVYLAAVRMRRYGRILSRRPSWEGRNREVGKR
jgi:hypothetical protein